MAQPVLEAVAAPWSVFDGDMMYWYLGSQLLGKGSPAVMDIAITTPGVSSLANKVDGWRRGLEDAHD